MPWRSVVGGAALLMASVFLGIVLFSPSRPQAPSPRASGDGAAPPQEAPPLDPREVAVMLAEHKEDPSLARFGSEFLSDPSLRAIWESYQKDADLEGLMKRLQRSQRFLDLYRRSSADPAFKRSVEALVHDPRLDAPLRTGKLRFPDVGEELGN